MIEVHLYGTLRRFGPTADPRVDCVVTTEPTSGDLIVRDLVRGLGIPDGVVASVFVNGRWMSDGIDAPIAGATRLGLFPTEMSLLYV